MQFGFCSSVCLSSYGFLGSGATGRIKFCPKVTRDSNQDFLIDMHLDLDVCRVDPKMSWIRYVVGISHFAARRENLPVTA